MGDNDDTKGPGGPGGPGNGARHNGHNGHNGRNGHGRGDGSPTYEDVKDLLSYPARVHIKAVGAHSARFEALVHSIVDKYIAPEHRLATSTRASRGGKYLAVTITVNAQSREQLDAIYQELSSCEDVLIAL